MQFFLKITPLVASCILLCNCGDGGGNGSDEPTVRPKSLNDLVLSFQNNTISLTFLRSNSSLNSATFETGVIDYSVRNLLEFHTARNGDTMDVNWPHRPGQLRYEYTPVNESSGRIRIISALSNYDAPPGAGVTELPRGGRTDTNGTRNVRLFSGDSTQFSTDFVVDFLSSNGQTIDLASLEIEPLTAAQYSAVTDAGAPVDPDVFIASINSASFSTTAQLRTKTFRAVTVNYGAGLHLAPDSYSVIANVSLKGRSLELDPDLEGATRSTFTFESAQPASSPAQVEAGEANFTAVINPTPPSVATDYSYESIIGTDSAVLNFTSFEQANSITLVYTNRESDSQQAGGTYTISGGALSGETGTFTLKNVID